MISELPAPMSALTVMLKVEENVPDERDRNQISSPQPSRGLHDTPSPPKVTSHRPGDKQAFFSKKLTVRTRSASDGAKPLLPKRASFHLPHADFNPSNLIFTTLKSIGTGASSYVLKASYHGYGTVAVKVIDITKCSLRSQLETELQVFVCVCRVVYVCICVGSIFNHPLFHRLTGH
jgi:hypothetical protein